MQVAVKIGALASKQKVEVSGRVGSVAAAEGSEGR
jgi:hypothetical protein